MTFLLIDSENKFFQIINVEMNLIKNVGLGILLRDGAFLAFSCHTGSTLSPLADKSQPHSLRRLCFP